MSNSRYLVEYTKEDGTIQRGIMYYGDQKPEFKKVCKVCVALFNQDFTPVLDPYGKHTKVLKNPDSLKVIGFID